MVQSAPANSAIGWEEGGYQIISDSLRCRARTSQEARHRSPRLAQIHSARWPRVKIAGWSA